MTLAKTQYETDYKEWTKSNSNLIFEKKNRKRTKGIKYFLNQKIGHNLIKKKAIPR